MKEQKRNRLERNMTTGQISGVCAGIADYLDEDVALVRLITFALLFVSFGWVLLIYIAGAICIPCKDDLDHAN